MRRMSLPAHIWINGKVFPTAEARISPFDHGFLVGDGVFETLVARNGKPFTAIRHWKRLVLPLICSSVRMGMLIILGVIQA